MNPSRIYRARIRALASVPSHATILLLILAALGTLLISGVSVQVTSDRQPVFGYGDIADGGPVGQSGDWELIFNDEFDGDSLDDRNWVTCYWWKDHWWEDDGCTNEGTGELQWYHHGGIQVDDGTLKLVARDETFQTRTFGDAYDYTSGMITTGRDVSDRSTLAKFGFQYGYAEVRARVPSGKGLWPALWMLPDDHNSKPEIDVIEILGDQPNVAHMNFHFMTDDGKKRKTGHTWTGEVFSDDWHVYAVDWQPEALVWYLDGVERWRYTDVANIPKEPMYLLANLAVGGDWPGEPDEDTVFPVFFDIDYVRVWTRATSPTTPVPTQPFVGASTLTPTSDATPAPISPSTIASVSDRGLFTGEVNSASSQTARSDHYTILDQNGELSMRLRWDETATLKLSLEDPLGTTVASAASEGEWLHLWWDVLSPGTYSISVQALSGSTGYILETVYP